MYIVAMYKIEVEYVLDVLFTLLSESIMNRQNYIERIVLVKIIFELYRLGKNQ